MFYKIDNKTYIDWPKWKCRQEFANYYIAKRDKSRDVDLLYRLKARCDEIEKKHIENIELARKAAHARWLKPGAHDRLQQNSVPIDVFDMNGNYIKTYPNAYRASLSLGLDYYHIKKCRNGRKKSLGGFMFRDHTGQTANIEPYKIDHRKPGYKRRPGTNPTRIVVSMENGAVFREWPSVKSCGEDLGVRSNTVIEAIKHNRALCGHVLQYGSSFKRN